MKFILLFSFFALALAFGFRVASISRILEVSPPHIKVRALFGRERQIPIDQIQELTMISMGFLSHATIRVKTDRFWPFAQATFLVPVRGNNLDQQSSLKELWDKVPSSEQLIL